ncbi:rab effector Noc2 isoform X1 [Rhincodon typus]|uniref:rab effector Noc2 isoform X1 n=1 Tax=Rhincodon typus TaxID=259920 RepID=UPI0009A3BC61|nr:rab effector Noc2 isoform X1 [Rhincodon typus]XP_048468669.1 rab effector Noc2 isoform X1 [Rhincodon typus]XP_048468670.1 rab effector Noc2 isoform X1 [Rhincodon typus]XP_048468671.1 rab effector Noc2 isoform X1 [Rhincodon typus]XP_048468672.1 rab effector Noc2 isoform X1 [Rhincodon typus]
MADTIFGSGTDQWVCPNDRQLALRAKLKTGWSVHSNESEKQRQNQILTKKEIAVILDVIKRAESLDLVEQKRIGRLVERLENMKKNVMGNGLAQCLLCGELLGFLGSTSVFCQDCRKKVCVKCGIETLGSQRRPIWLCKICSERREIWKRSGAWFYKGLPKYILPLKSTARNSELQLRPIQMEHGQSIIVNRSYSWAKGRVVSSDSESESECSNCSQDDNVSANSSKNHNTEKGREESGRKMKVSSYEPTSKTATSYKLTNTLSESRTSLGSEHGGHSSATGSYIGDGLCDDCSDFDKNSLADESKHVWQFDKTRTQRHNMADSGILK